MAADEPASHEDVLHLLQVESVVKRVPNGLNNVRRIVQYAIDPNDDGGSSHGNLSAAPVEVWVLWIGLVLTVLALFGLLVYYLRPTARGGARRPLLLQPQQGGDVAIDMDFSDGNSKTYFMQNVMQTLKTLED